MAGIFFKRQLTAVEKLENLLEENPCYPFKQNEDKLEFSARYARFWAGLIGSIVSLIVVILMAALDQFENTYFLWPALALIVSLFTLYSYREVRNYTLDPTTLTYTFRLGQRVVVKSEYHNVYIRLRSKIASGHVYYYLIFNGYRIDKIFVSSDSEDLTGMRRLGQRLASNLNLNYFDIANVSPHHVVMHRKATKTPRARTTRKE